MAHSTVAWTSDPTFFTSVEADTLCQEPIMQGTAGRLEYLNPQIKQNPLALLKDISRAQHLVNLTAKESQISRAAMAWFFLLKFQALD